MSFFDLLKDEHKEVAKLLEEGHETTQQAVKTRSTIFSKIKHKLDNHTTMEEKFFYPVLKKCDETKDLILEAYEEHDEVKDMLTKIENTDPSDETWAAKFTVLKENVEHHVKEEEHELFPKAKKALSKEKIAEITREMENFKQSQK